MGKRKEITIEKGESLTSVVASAAAGMTRAKAYMLIKAGEVKVNGVRVRNNTELNVGDVVSVFLPDSVCATPHVKIVYDDENIVVFDKDKHTPFDMLGELYGKPILAVHRLDTNTKGLIVFAKAESAERELTAAFKDRRVVKRYEAVVLPPPKNLSGTFTAYTVMKDGIAVVSDAQCAGYKTMVTEYTVKERVGQAAVLTVTPHTGRTHQIRAHLKHLGCPIIGDPKYGGERAVDGAPKTQMLSAVELTFSGLSGELSYLNGKTFKTDSGFDLAFLKDMRA